MEPAMAADDAADGGAGPRTLALLTRMGSHPSAWAYLDTLARVAGFRVENAAATLEELEQRGLVTSERRPAGPVFRLTELGVRARLDAQERT